jgi:hypothetical protein
VDAREETSILCESRRATALWRMRPKPGPWTTTNLGFFPTTADFFAVGHGPMHDPSFFRALLFALVGWQRRCCGTPCLLPLHGYRGRFDLIG